MLNDQHPTSPLSPRRPPAQVDISDAMKTAEAFLKISSVYKEENEEVKAAVLDSIGEGAGERWRTSADRLHFMLSFFYFLEWVCQLTVPL